MALALQNVTVMAGAKRLIDGVSLAIEPGRLTVVLGANGAGKSTALGVMAGDIRPAYGEALLDGVPLARLSPTALARHRAVVLQQSPMSFPLKVHEVVALAHTSFGRQSDRKDAVDERVLRTLGLMAFANQDYTSLSGGERQRVQIARALAQLGHNDDDRGVGYLLMDEPTAHLDLKHQITALEAARKFADGGGGVLCILHDLILARDFSDEVVMMKDGRIVAKGEAGELLKPALIAEIYDIPKQRAEQLAML